MKTNRTSKGTILMIGNYLLKKKWNKNISYYLAKNLRMRSWEIIITSSKENQFLRLLDMLWTTWQERKNYTLAHIDVFSGKAFLYSEFCTLLLRVLRKPYILNLHGGGLPEFSIKYPKRIINVLSRAKIVVTPSRFIKSSLSDFRNDIRLIRNPVDISSSIYRVREIVKPNLIWVRAFHQVYNPIIVPDVVKALRTDFPEIHLTMLGPDKGDGSLDKMLLKAKQLGVERNITITGSINHSEIPIWLDKADIFINTTNYDTAPRSLLEAMANGLCIVSTNVGGIPYMIKDGKTGLLVARNDPLAMAEACKKILNNPILAKKISVNARKNSEQWDWSNILPIWENLILEMSNTQ